MAARKSRAKRNRSDFILEVSMISVVVMCLQMLPITKCATTPIIMLADSNEDVINGDVIRESVVIPSSDPEKEAQELYEKSLKEFGIVEGKTLKNICSSWSSSKCMCSGNIHEISLTCHGLGLTEVPLNLPEEVVNLSLEGNNITNLPKKSFDMTPNLEELNLSANMLRKIDSDAFLGLNKLKRLSLQNCGLTVIPGESFRRIPHLLSLNLGNNLLTIISAGDFPQLQNLVVLLLKRNQIVRVDAEGFNNLPSLKIMELDDNLLSSLPIGLNKMSQLQELSASGNRIQWLGENELPKGLQTLDFRGNPLKGMSSNALKDMIRLRKLVLSDVRNLEEFPNLEGCGSLEILRLDRAGLVSVPTAICRNSSRLRSLELKMNGIIKIPEINNCKELRLLDLSSNKIESLNGKPFQGLSALHDLLLSHNIIKHIPYDAFFGIPRLQLLDLEGNQITEIHENAFASFVQLEDLNLGNNKFSYLPYTGLHRLLHLKTFNNPKLKEFPAPDVFPRIQSLILSYAYHCCPFLPLVTMSATRKPSLVQEAVLFPSDSEFDMSLWNNSMTDIWPQLHNLSKKFGNQISDLWDTFGQDFLYPGNLPSYVEEYFEEEGNTPIRTTGSEIITGSVQCLPLPGPFLPCADLFDWWTLRCGVWVVFLLAMLGNGTVVFVLIFSRSKMDVPRFLVCNLAAADFFMGVYLGILAIVDASTLGEFRMYAIPWQMSVMCQIAGFLAVLSSELSVYTLAVITLERNYAITHAIHLNKRLSLRQATYIMLFGWAFSLTMAILPLIGISDYRKFAVCLPFEITTGIASLTYVVALMFINGCAFLTLMGCYLKMYWAIKGSQAWNTNDSRIAKRMALLVFTDFLCWSPIAFFSLTAIFGLQLISLEQAKIFTVFILPLNSCCNPFLYAIMTKQFKKDCVMICKALEESRVTRTLGKCERPPRELPPLLPPPGCRCLKMLPHEMPRQLQIPTIERNIWSRAWNRIICNKNRNDEKRNVSRLDPYTYRLTEIHKGKKPRASSISSENFCSSRSSSWRNGPPPVHNCAIPLKIIDSRRHHSAWLITRKTSQDSNLSTSRNDSSASATTASTSTFRLSRSSAGSTTPIPSVAGCSSKQNSNLKPRLVRQQAVQEEDDSSPPRLGVRFLPTIPSAADSSIVLEEESHDQTASTQFYTVLQSGNTKSTLSSPTNTNRPP